MIHRWKAIDLEIIDSEHHHESACCWISGAANNISDRRCELKERAGEWARPLSKRGYCRILSVARAITRFTGIIRIMLYYSLHQLIGHKNFATKGRIKLNFEFLLLELFWVTARFLPPGLTSDTKTGWSYSVIINGAWFQAG